MWNSYSLFVSGWLPVFAGQRNSELAAAQSHGCTAGGDENVECAHPQGAHAWQEGVAQLHAGHHEPEITVIPNLN